LSAGFLDIIRDKRISFLLGTGDLADAYSIAFRIPNTLRRLVGEGAVSAAFIPVFSQYLAEGKRKETWEFVNTILSAAIVVMSVVVILGILGSSYIMAFFAGGFAPRSFIRRRFSIGSSFPISGL
jgi:putative peptidoglycan lipid II flippase